MEKRVDTPGVDFYQFALNLRVAGTGFGFQLLTDWRPGFLPSEDGMVAFKTVEPA